MAQDVIPLANEVDQLLEALSRDLAASLNPHRLALQSLGLREYGWVETPYSDEAFKLWSGLLRKHPDDLDNLHHLAILHHARAIDLEADKEPRRADADWEKALAYWQRLWQSDAFWDRIAEIACKKEKRDAVERLRAELPALLLQIHFDIAFDARAKNYRAKYHIKTALASSFPDEAKETVRKRTYEQFMSGVPQTIWQGSEMNTEVIKEGTDRIKQYLELDPGGVTALEDALRLQDRLLDAWFTKLKSLGDQKSPQRQALLKTMKKAAAEWMPYLKQLVPMGERLDDAARKKLWVWMRVMGDIHRALDQHADAIRYYEHGATIECLDPNGGRSCTDRIGATYVHLAHAKMTMGGFQEALPLLNQAERSAPSDISVYFLRCQCYLAGGHKPDAEDDLRMIKKLSSGLDPAEAAQVKSAIANLEMTINRMP